MKGTPRKDIRAALVELQTQLPIPNEELEQSMTGWQSHPIEFARIPSTYDVTTTVRVGSDLLHDLCNLIHVSTIRFSPIAPLGAIHPAQISAVIRPLIPDRHLILTKVGDIGVPLQKPKQLVDDRTHMKFLGRDQRETG